MLIELGNLELANLHWLVINPQGSTVSTFPELGLQARAATLSVFSTDSRGLYVGPDAYLGNSFLTEPISPA